MAKCKWHRRRVWNRHRLLLQEAALKEQARYGREAIRQAIRDFERFG